MKWGRLKEELLSYYRQARPGHRVTWKEARAIADRILPGEEQAGEEQTSEEDDDQWWQATR